MLAGFLDAIKESSGRRLLPVLLGCTMVFAVVSNLIVHLSSDASGDGTIVLGTRPIGAPEQAVPDILTTFTSLGGTIWLLLSIGCAVPILASTVEKGWVELILTKSAARWEIFLGRYLAGVTLFAVATAASVLPLAFRLWWLTGVNVFPILLVLLFQVVSFSALLAIAALVCLARQNVVFPMACAVVVWLVSPLLATRHDSYYQVVTSYGGRFVLDLVYIVLPKCAEISAISSVWMRDGELVTWWPIWSSALFTVIVVSATLHLLEQKSF